MYCQLIDSPSIYFYLVIFIIIVHSYFLINKKRLWNTLKVFSVLGFVFPPITLIIYFYVILKKEVDTIEFTKRRNAIPFFIGIIISFLFLLFMGIRSCNKEMSNPIIMDKPFEVNKDEGSLYWDFVHKQPKNNIIYECDDYFFGNRTYEIAIYRNSSVNIENGIGITKNNRPGEVILMKNINGTPVYAKQDTLIIPLRKGKMWEHLLGDNTNKLYKEKLYWDSESKILYYYYVSAQ